jgi:type III secretion protein L
MSKNLIKNHADKTTAARSNLIKSRLFEAQIEARKILENAERRAADIIAAAVREADDLRRAAVAEAKEQIAAEFSEIVVESLRRRETILRDAEQEILRLSVKIAEKIIGREIALDGAAVAEIVANALRNARRQERLTIRVNPSDLSAVWQIKNSAVRADLLDFEADPQIAVGGCVITSDTGTIDARLETQLKILEKNLLEQAAAQNRE